MYILCKCDEGEHRGGEKCDEGFHVYSMII
jgi:hypothetical protein